MHTEGNFQVWIPPESLEPIISWLMIHRGNHSCLIHPLTVEEFKDHTERGIWLGEKVPFNEKKLAEKLSKCPSSRPHSTNDCSPYVYQPFKDADGVKTIENPENLISFV